MEYFVNRANMYALCFVDIVGIGTFQSRVYAYCVMST